MAETGARESRAAAREERRSMTAKPFEELDESATSEGSSQRDELAKALRRAAVAAVAGGLGGAAKAAVDRRRRDRDANEEEDEPAAPRNAQAAEPEPEREREPEPEAAAESSDEDNDDVTDAPEESDDEREPVSGAPASDVAEAIDRARTHVRELLGFDVDGVSGIQRANGSWSVMLEVVEMHRVPESTDVMSSYEVVLDDDGNIVRLDRKRRYRRAQVEEMS